MKEKSKFKEGDIVNAYWMSGPNHPQKCKGVVTCAWRNIITMEVIDGGDYIRSGSLVSWHIKQCRKVIKSSRGRKALQKNQKKSNQHSK